MEDESDFEHFQLQHESTINCLHNYTLGKMGFIFDQTVAAAPKTRFINVFIKYLPRKCIPAYTGKGHSAHSKRRITFAANLEMIYNIETGECNEFSSEWPVFLEATSPHVHEMINSTQLKNQH